MEDELLDAYHSGIEEFKEEVVKRLCPGKSLEEFFQRIPHLSCDKAWDNVTNIAVHCRECGIESGSCVCLKCFLSGNHEGHHITINPSSHANCDCGNEALWRSSGYCSHHIGRTLDSDIIYIPKDSRNILYIVCKILVTDLEQQLKHDDEEQAIKIIDYLTELTKYGDPVRRVVTRAIETYSSYRILLSRVTSYGEFLRLAVFEFFGGCLTDRSFIENASADFYYEFPNLLESVTIDPNPEDFKIQPYVGFKNMIGFSFHFFHTKSFLNTAKKDPNFVETYTKVINTIVLNMNRNGYLFYRKTQLGTILQYISKMISSLSKDPSMREKLMELSKGAILSICQYDALFNYFTIEVDEKIDAFQTAEAFTALTSNTVALLVEAIGENKLLPDNFFDIFSYMISESDLIVESELASSVLHPLTRISFCTSMHQAMAYYLSNFGDEISTKFNEIASANGFDPNLLSLHIARHPLRLIAASWLAQQDFFVRNPNPTISSLYSLSMGTFRVRKYSALFALIQYMAGITEDKDRFVNMVAGIFGTDKEPEKTVLVFLYFILNLVLNRTFIPPSTKRYVLSSLSNLMRNGPKPAKDFLEIEWRKNKLFDILIQIAENIGTDMWQLKTNEYVEKVNPWDLLIVFFNFVTEENEKGNIPFEIKEFHEIPGLNLTGILMSDALTPFILTGLTQSNTVTNQIAMNLIWLRRQIDPNSLTEEIVSQIKCEPFLVKIGLAKPSTESEENKQSKEELKKSVIDQFQSMLTSFSFDDVSDEEEEKKDVPTISQEQECPICCQNTSAPCGYPALLVASPVQNLVEHTTSTIGAPLILCCQHTVHLGCSPAAIRSCPVCRVMRNFFLPKVVGVSDEDLKRKEYSDAITSMFSEFKYFLKQETEMVAPWIIETLITTLELRVREKPQVLTHESYKIIVQNLLQIINRVFVHIEPGSSMYSMVMEAAYYGIESIKAFEKGASPIRMRQIAIFKYLSGADIDINSELAKYSENLKPFDLHPLKPSLLHYYLTEEGDEIAFNNQHAYILLSGKVVPQDFTLSQKLEHPVEAVMPINGATAGLVYLWCQKFSMARQFVGLYTDENGNDDIGFSNHSYVKLNRTMQRELIDIILSCEWISAYDDHL